MKMIIKSKYIIFNKYKFPPKIAIKDYVFIKLYFVLVMKSHLESYPCPLIINSFWNLGFLLGITILLQIITGIFLSLYYISDINSTYFSIFFLIREIYYGWYLRYFHSNGASFVFLFFSSSIGSPPNIGSKKSVLE